MIHESLLANYRRFLLGFPLRRLPPLPARPPPSGSTICTGASLGGGRGGKPWISSDRFIGGSTRSRSEGAGAALPEGGGPVAGRSERRSNSEPPLLIMGRGGMGSDAAEWPSMLACSLVDCDESAGERGGRRMRMGAFAVRDTGEGSRGGGGGREASGQRVRSGGREPRSLSLRLTGSPMKRARSG